MSTNEIIANNNQYDVQEPHEHGSAQAIVSLDTLGIAASTACLIHCLAMPFVITLLPVMGWQFLEGKAAHHFLAALVVSFALFAVVPGYFKHKHITVFAGMVLGLTLVLVATFICGAYLQESLELPLITVGNLILVATHWRNRNLSSCEHLHHHATIDCEPVPENV